MKNQRDVMTGKLYDSIEQRKEKGLREPCALIGSERCLGKPGLVLLGLMLTVCLIFSLACPGWAADQESAPEANPFLSPYRTPFEVPPFDQIRNEHYLPAFLEGMSEQMANIEEIISNPEPPTFENTIFALDYTGWLLGRVAMVFFNLLGTMSSDEMEEIAGQVQPMLAEHSDNIILNRELFARVETVYDQRDVLDLTEEDSMLLEKTYLGFTMNGALLSQEEQEKLREINQALSMLSLQFMQNVLADTESFTLFIEHQEDLSGLPQSVIDAAREAAAREGREDAWLFTLQETSAMPFLTHADNRELRKVVNQAWINRGNNDNEFNNREILRQIIELRLKRSQLFGYENYAAYALRDRMAETPDIVESFQNELWEAALPIAQKEAALLQEMIDSRGEDFELAYWDWRYYAEKIRQEFYALDESVIQEYFEIDRVLEGMFEVTERLWGIQIVERPELPRYHPQVSTWEVMEADGTHLGILYMDLYPRIGKRSGAWMSVFRPQYIDPDGEFVHPVISFVSNVTPPTADRPSLVSLSNIKTLFHEFGHTLHGLFSRVRYPSQSGTAVSRDFVELPSMLMELWAAHPEIRKEISRHYQTGESIPDQLIEDLEAAKSFNQGFTLVELLASGLLDYEYHVITEYEPFEVDEFEAWVQEKYQMMDEIYFRHGSTHFMHIFSYGYAMAYYGYLWAEVLAADVFEAFLETGDLFDRETAQRFREEILERGGSRSPMEMYVSFRGREPEIEPLLRVRGLLEE